MADEEVVSVEIHGQRYPIRSSLDPEYVARLARYVDEKMLAALNVADELFRCRDTNKARSGEIAARAGELERILDRVLMAS